MRNTSKTCIFVLFIVNGSQIFVFGIHKKIGSKKSSDIGIR